MNLRRAAKNNEIERVNFLLDQGEDVNQRDADGNTALHYASMNGHLAVVNRLLDAPMIDVNFQDNEGWTALHFASFSDYPDIVQKLLDHDADPSIKDNGGLSPIDIAMNDVVKNLLIEYDLTSRLQIVGKSNLEKDEQCALCLENFADSDDIVLKTNCENANHMFHLKCLANLKLRKINRCPICRRENVLFGRKRKSRRKSVSKKRRSIRKKK